MMYIRWSHETPLRRLMCTSEYLFDYDTWLDIEFISKVLFSKESDAAAVDR